MVMGSNLPFGSLWLRFPVCCGTDVDCPSSLSSRAGCAHLAYVSYDSPTLNVLFHPFPFPSFAPHCFDSLSNQFSLHPREKILRTSKILYTHVYVFSLLCNFHCKMKLAVGYSEAFGVSTID